MSQLKILISSILLFSCIAPSAPILAEVQHTSSVENQEINESIIDVNGAQLFCRTMGRGKPLVVLHGGPGLSQDYLQPQLYKLAEDNFLIFYDQRACGRSSGDISPETINMQTYIEDIEALREAFHFDTISIFGHSWGGFLALNYAIAHPTRVDKLILTSSIPSTSYGTYLFIQEYLKRLAPYQSELAEIRNSQEYLEGNPDVMERFYKITFSTYMFQPQSVKLLNLRMSKRAFLNDRQVNEIFRKSVFMSPYNLEESLKGLNIPTLVIHGDHDTIPATTAQATHESIKNSEYVLIKNCGHFPYVEAPEKFFKAIHEFIK